MNEREEFEKFMRGRMFIKSDFRRDELDHYREYFMQAHWEVWQARATLDKPETTNSARGLTKEAALRIGRPYG